MKGNRLEGRLLEYFVVEGEVWQEGRGRQLRLLPAVELLSKRQEFHCPFQGRTVRRKQVRQVCDHSQELCLHLEGQQVRIHSSRFDEFKHKQ